MLMSAAEHAIARQCECACPAFLSRCGAVHRQPLRLVIDFCTFASLARVSERVESSTCVSSVVIRAAVGGAVVTIELGARSVTEVWLRRRAHPARTRIGSVAAKIVNTAHRSAGFHQAEWRGAVWHAKQHNEAAGCW
ncbi:hypothetical protein ERJ75_000597900 [Trypanosoma vivax]|nr:hypothetical protein ERJ75_000597900 [Trypanosoma vivax]